MMNAFAEHSDAVLNAVPVLAVLYLVVYVARRLLRVHEERKSSS